MRLSAVFIISLVKLRNVGAALSPSSPRGILSMSTSKSPAALSGDLYRKDGVRIVHDPYAPGMAAKYGAPGETDNEGFNPYADSVGAGIYSGTVQRRKEDGSVITGKQYQNHNPTPGPVYSGGGYTPISSAIAKFRREIDRGLNQSSTSLAKLLDEHPDLVNDVATGGATPLHTCGMSQDNQHATAFIIARGGDVAAVDTYGYTPLARMASNNLAVGIEALLLSGADPSDDNDLISIAKRSAAYAALTALRQHGAERKDKPVLSLRVFSTTRPEVVGTYSARPDSEIPKGFAAVCVKSGWDVKSTWIQLNGGEGGTWFKHESNDSYVYFNALDGMWWIDGPDGRGVYKGRGPKWSPMGMSTAWMALDGGSHQPTLAIYRP